MWPASFSARLAAWNHLRQHCQALDVESALLKINQWWFGSPWRAYYLHWDDAEFWPDPWQLLSDNIYCEVARGLGILYTVKLLDRPDITDARLVQTQEAHNLVLVGQTKYILNWDLDNVVNTFQEVKIKQQFQHHHIM